MEATSALVKFHPPTYTLDPFLSVLPKGFQLLSHSSTGCYLTYLPNSYDNHRS